MVLSVPWFSQVSCAGVSQGGRSRSTSGQPAPWGASPPQGRRRGEVLKMTTGPALFQESLHGPNSAKPTHRSSPSVRTALGGDASLRRAVKCFAEQGPTSSVEPPCSRQLPLWRRTVESALGSRWRTLRNPGPDREQMHYWEALGS